MRVCAQHLGGGNRKMASLELKEGGLGRRKEKGGKEEMKYW